MTSDFRGQRKFGLGYFWASIGQRLGGNFHADMATLPSMAPLMTTRSIGVVDDDVVDAPPREGVGWSGVRWGRGLFTSINVWSALRRDVMTEQETSVAR